MAKIETHACDVCSLQRQTTNHWWKIYRLLDGAIVLSWEAEEPGVYVGDGPAHLCGIQHVLEWLSKNILEVKQ